MAGELQDDNITVKGLCRGATTKEFERTVNLENIKLLSRKTISHEKDASGYGYEAIVKYV